MAARKEKSNQVLFAEVTVGAIFLVFISFLMLMGGFGPLFILLVLVLIGAIIASVIGKGKTLHPLIYSAALVLGFFAGLFLLSPCGAPFGAYGSLASFAIPIFFIILGLIFGKLRFVKYYIIFLLFGIGWIIASSFFVVPVFTCGIGGLRVPSCVAAPGFLCQSIILSHTTGYLSVRIGQSTGTDWGNSIIVFGIQGSALGSNGFPIVYSGGNYVVGPLRSGQTITAIFANAAPVSSPVGTFFAGSVWPATLRERVRFVTLQDP